MGGGHTSKATGMWSMSPRMDPGSNWRCTVTVAPTERAGVVRRFSPAKWNMGVQVRIADQRRVARSLSRKGALRSGLSEARATDIMWAIANPNTHRGLIGERGWATKEYELWLAQVLISALFEEPARN